MKPTQEIYSELQNSYNFFNEELFSSELPECLITVQRKRSVKGYFAKNWWKNSQEQSIDEIALNPDFLHEHKLKEVLSTLVHEMCHLWQSRYGSPGRAGYHNKQWADKMESIGLMPSDTGTPGGKTTGDSMTHYILIGGKFEKSFEKLAEKGKIITWFDNFTSNIPRIDINDLNKINNITRLQVKQLWNNLIDQGIIRKTGDIINNGIINSIVTGEARLILDSNVQEFETDILEILKKIFVKKKKENKKNKIKYTCEKCDINAWAKPEIILICGSCKEELRANQF